MFSNLNMINFYFLFNLTWLYSIYKIIKCKFSFIYIIYRHYIRNPNNIKLRYGNNTWVVITGATDGIGKGFAIEFAKYDFNILLISRNKEKLINVCKEIENYNSKIKTDFIVFDFEKNNNIIDYTNKFNFLIKKKYNISILINNIGYGNVKYFNNQTLEYTQDMIDLNVKPQALLTNMLINIFKYRYNFYKKHSCIINLSSFASSIVSKKFIQYNSCKAFNDYYSKGIFYELNNKYYIDSISVKPMYVATPLTKMNPNWYHVITTEKLCKSVINQLGFDKESFGHILHEIQARIINSMPNFILKYFGILSLWEGSIL